MHIAIKLIGGRPQMAKVIKRSDGYEFVGLSTAGMRIVNEFQRQHPSLCEPTSEPDYRFIHERVHRGKCPIGEARCAGISERPRPTTADAHNARLNGRGCQVSLSQAANTPLPPPGGFPRYLSGRSEPTLFLHICSSKPIASQSFRFLERCGGSLWGL